VITNVLYYTAYCTILYIKKCLLMSKWFSKAIPCREGNLLINMNIQVYIYIFVGAHKIHETAKGKSAEGKINVLRAVFLLSYYKMFHFLHCLKITLGFRSESKSSILLADWKPKQMPWFENCLTLFLPVSWQVLSHVVLLQASFEKNDFTDLNCSLDLCLSA